MGRMIDITDKNPVKRSATATGVICLKSSTISSMTKGKIKKGNPFEIAKIAGIQAAKQTSLLIPLCHQLNLNSVEISFRAKKYSIVCICTVKTIAKTGVEMEALLGVTNALNTIWDMVKYLEKDKAGQYPDTKITDIKVIEKKKGK